jgi:surface polysaccharide O-acyltransferase-like enzyme
MSAQRIVSIDAARSLGILAIICIHTGPFLGAGFNATEDMLAIIINQTAHCAVPFFFVAAGYFLAKKMATDRSPLRVAASYSGRLLAVFVFWSLAYVLVPPHMSIVKQHHYWEFTSARILAMLQDPMALVFEGTRGHLWFIVSLALAVWEIALLAKIGQLRKLPYLAALLYVVGLLGGSYATSPLGLDLHFNTRNGPFFGTLMVAIGWYIARRRPAPSLRTAAGLAAIGVALSVAEIAVLWKCLGVHPVRHDFLLGTAPLAAGLFLALLARPNLGRNSGLPQLAQYSLGMYACHVFFVDRWYRLKPPSANHVFELGFPLLVFGASLGVVWLLARSRFLRPFVTGAGIASRDRAVPPVVEAGAVPPFHFNQGRQRAGRAVDGDEVGLLVPSPLELQLPLLNAPLANHHAQRDAR